jgi:hypothetical protein
MLEEFEEDIDTRAKAADHHRDGKNDPRQMLAELEKDLNLRTQITSQRKIDNDDSLEVLCGNVAALCSPRRGDTVRDSFSAFLPPSCHRLTPEFQQANVGHKLDQEAIPYAIALQLERIGTSWNRVKGWTEYLFSQGPNSYEAVAEKDVIVERVFLSLNKVIEQTLANEAGYRAIEEKAGLSSRLIATNLAADVDETELSHLFREFRYDM